MHSPRPSCSSGSFRCRLISGSAEWYQVVEKEYCLSVVGVVPGLQAFGVDARKQGAKPPFMPQSTEPSSLYAFSSATKPLFLQTFFQHESCAHPRFPPSPPAPPHPFTLFDLLPKTLFLNAQPPSISFAHGVSGTVSPWCSNPLRLRKQYLELIFFLFL